MKNEIKMNHFKPMLAHNYDHRSAKGWLMSEKLDGVRAIWDGEKLMSRNGNQFFSPAWFTSQLPSGIMLDGELFAGRGNFQIAAGIVRRKSPVDSEWEKIQFCVFDAPQAKGIFADRLSYCEEVLSGVSVAVVVPHRVCIGKRDLENFFDEMAGKGAEGIMLRAPKSRYTNGRTQDLLKYKSSDSDEAVMISTEPGEGRFEGLAGAFILKWGKKKIKVGTGISDELRANPPKAGAVITFGFFGLTNSGSPRFPTFVCERSYE